MNSLERLERRVSAKRTEQRKAKQVVWNEAKRTDCDEFIRDISSHFEITGIAVNGLSWGNVAHEDAEWCKS